MKPFTIKQEIEQKPLTITFQNPSHKTPPSNHISTSPHSLCSPDTNKGHPIKLTPNQIQNISCKGPFLGQIQICLNNRLCVLNCAEGEACMRKLSESLEEWGTSQQSKISLKMLVSYKLSEGNPKLKHVFYATVREYEQSYGILQ